MIDRVFMVLEVQKGHILVVVNDFKVLKNSRDASQRARNIKARCDETGLGLGPLIAPSRRASTFYLQFGARVRVSAPYANETRITFCHNYAHLC